MARVSLFLIFAGLVPFFICTLCLVFDVNSLPLLGSTTHVLKLYSLTIAVFLAGCHWGQHLSLDGKWVRLLPLTSNIIAITLWLVFLACTFKIFIIVCVLFFIVLLGIDYRLFENDHISVEYFRTRSLVTVNVCLTMITVGVIS